MSHALSYYLDLPEYRRGSQPDRKELLLAPITQASRSGEVGAKQSHNVFRNAPRLSAIVRENPLRRGPNNDCLIFWDLSTQDQTTGDWDRCCYLWFSTDEVMSFYARPARLIQPGDDAQQVTCVGWPQEHDVVAPRNEHATETSKSVQRKTEKRCMIDRSLFQVVEVRRVVRVTERVHLMKSDAEARLEQLGAGIRD